LSKKADVATGDVKEAKEALNMVRASEFICKTKWSAAKTKLKEAKRKMQDSDEALKAAEAIKQKLAGIIESAISLYDWFVHEPLRNLMLDGENPLAFFDEVGEEEAAAKKGLTVSMQSLVAHCNNEARPAFEKVTSVTLAPLCEIPSDITLYETLEKRKQEVKADLETARGYLKDFTPPPGSDQANEVAQPVMLDEVVEAFQTPSFAAQYMPKWKTDGQFLKAIEKLRLIIQGLAEQSGQLQENIGLLADSIKNNIKLRVAARAKLNEAIDASKFAEGEKNDAEQLLATQEAQEEEQNANLDELQSIADEAYKHYNAALKTFDQHFIAGTRLALLEKRNHTRNDDLKLVRPVRRVA